MSHRIDVEAAREYFADPSQQKAADLSPDDLPDEGFQYWARGGVCLVFHKAHWPNVWMVHCAAKPDAWGRAEQPARELLSEFWNAEQPALIVGWVKHSNRAALSFARRVGFEQHGSMALRAETVIELNWRPS